ncbi:hypothetical protein ACLMJK_002666 [Lecanora helva]
MPSPNYILESSYKTKQNRCRSVAYIPYRLAELAEAIELDGLVELDDLVADFALAVDIVDAAELLLEAIEDIMDDAEVAEDIDDIMEAEDAEEAMVMLMVADALALGVADSTVFELSTTKGAL